MDGVARGSPLAPILARILISYHEENWLNECPVVHKQTFYRTYVDDMFVLLTLLGSTHSFEECMFSKYQKINFIGKHEQHGFILVFTCQNFS